MQYSWDTLMRTQKGEKTVNSFTLERKIEETYELCSITLDTCSNLMPVLTTIQHNTRGRTNPTVTDNKWLVH